MATAMTGDPTPGMPATRSTTLVWIDAREAIIVRWHDNRARLERVASDVPPHHRATGHVRHDPVMRHGGGGSPQTAGEPRRLEHLERFLAQIAERVSPDDDLLILGPGTVHERLEQRIQVADETRGRVRTITGEPSSRMSDRQLMAHLRRFVGIDPRRRTIGAHRWSEPARHRPPGEPIGLPRRLGDKPHHESDEALR